MKKYIKILAAIIVTLLVLSAAILPAFADNEPADNAVLLTAAEEEAPAEESADNTTNTKAITAGALIAVVAAIGAIAMAIAIKSASEGISRQPEAAGNIRTNVMLGLVFIETAIIYALIVAILIIFVL